MVAWRWLLHWGPAAHPADAARAASSDTTCPCPLPLPLTLPVPLPVCTVHTCLDPAACPLALVACATGHCTRHIHRPPYGRRHIEEGESSSSPLSLTDTAALFDDVADPTPWLGPEELPGSREWLAFGRNPAKRSRADVWSFGVVRHRPVAMRAPPSPHTQNTHTEHTPHLNCPLLLAAFGCRLCFALFMRGGGANEAG